jgi:DNA replication protein DnaC
MMKANGNTGKTSKAKPPTETAAAKKPGNNLATVQQFSGSPSKLSEAEEIAALAELQRRKQANRGEPVKLSINHVETEGLPVPVVSVPVTRMGEAANRWRQRTQAEIDQAEKQIEEARRLAMVAKLLDGANIPEIYASAELVPPGVFESEDRRNYERAAAIILAAAESGRGMLAILGPPGLGKSYLAAAAVRLACNLGKSGMYRKTLDFFIDLRGGYGGKNNERAVLDSYIRPKVLAFDETAERGESDWENRMLGYVLDRRYEEARLTILTSNDKPEQFGKSLGERVMSRLSETGKIIICAWRPIREKK